jgi:hypothetical protein
MIEQKEMISFFKTRHVERSPINIEMVNFMKESKIELTKKPRKELDHDFTERSSNGNLDSTRDGWSEEASLPNSRSVSETDGN